MVVLNTCRCYMHFILEGGYKEISGYQRDRKKYFITTPEHFLSSAPSKTKATQASWTNNGNISEAGFSINI